MLTLTNIFSIYIYIHINIKQYIQWVINSAVECLPYKQKVTGSNPVLPILFRAYRLMDQDRNLLSFKCRFDSYWAYTTYRIIFFTDFSYNFFFLMLFYLSLKISHLLLLYIKKLVKGLEPPTYGLQIRCSTIELHQHLVSYYLN